MIKEVVLHTVTTAVPAIVDILFGSPEPSEPKRELPLNLTTPFTQKQFKFIKKAYACWPRTEDELVCILNIRMGLYYTKHDYRKVQRGYITKAQCPKGVLYFNNDTSTLT